MTEPKFTRLTGMTYALPNGETRDIRFILTTDDEASPLCLVARYGVAQQVASALGTCVQTLRTVLDQQKAWEQVAPQRIREARIQKDHLSETLMVELTVEPLGIPYLFQLPVQIASEFADRLKSEAGKTASIGNA